MLFYISSHKRPRDGACSESDVEERICLRRSTCFPKDPWTLSLLLVDDVDDFGEDRCVDKGYTEPD